MDDADAIAVYNTAELYGVRILRAAAQEFSTGVPAGQVVHDAVHELTERYGMTGLESAVAALGRLAAVELAARAERTGSSVHDLVAELEQHAAEHDEE